MNKLFLIFIISLKSTVLHGCCNSNDSNRVELELGGGNKVSQVVNIKLRRKYCCYDDRNYVVTVTTVGRVTQVISERVEFQDDMERDEVLRAAGFVENDNGFYGKKLKGYGSGY